MCTKFVRLVLTGSILTMGVQACIPLQSSRTENEQVTALAATLSVIQETVSAMQTMPVTPSPFYLPTVTLAHAPTPAVTNTPVPILIIMTVVVTAVPSQYQIPTTDNASVIHDALCWLGPGPGYVVSSAIKKGTRVIMLGTTSLNGWWVVRNPTYHDACWIYLQNLKLDTGVDPATMMVFTPPPTFTPTSRPTSTGTPTLTPTP